MPVIRIEPSGDVTLGWKQYPDNGYHYTKINGSDFPNTSIYQDVFYNSGQYESEHFYYTLASEIPVGSIITQLKLFATISTANVTQEQKMGFTVWGQTEVTSTTHSGTTGIVSIDYTWTTNPITGVAWTVDELSNPNNRMSAWLKQSNPAANYNQYMRFYGEVTYSAPSTFIPKIMIS